MTKPFARIFDTAHGQLLATIEQDDSFGRHVRLMVRMEDGEPRTMLGVDERYTADERLAALTQGDAEEIAAKLHHG